MSESAAFTAFHVAERLRHRVEAPWEVYGERLRRFEVHLNGAKVEMTRSPVTLEGYGLRVFRPIDGKMGVGVSGSSDLREAGIDAAATSAEETARFSRFPARRIELPATAARPPSATTSDPELWERPMEAIDRYVHALLEPFDRSPGFTPSFGSIRVTLGEVTLANSEGIQRHFTQTSSDVEFAVKSSGGPEGTDPGEFWVNHRSRRLGTDGLGDRVRNWCRMAKDVRGAREPETGPTNVVISPSVLADVLPAIVGYRMSGAAELRKISPAIGSTVASPLVTIDDNGLLPYGIGTAPFDDEGVPQARRTLIDRGNAAASLYDLLHAAALGQTSTGNGRRDSPLFPAWFHFTQSPGPHATNLVLAPGQGGSESELCEAAGEGLWVDQLGYSFPDPLTGSFGGELRSAYRIRHGKIAEAVRGGTLGSVVFAPPGDASFLTSVKAIGSRPVLEGALMTPPVLFEGLSVAGS